MQKRHRSIEELRDTRVTTTFKVELTFDLPYLDNKKYLDQRLSEAIEEILSQINRGKTDGHFSTDDGYQMGHKTEALYGYEEETEYNIHDWDI